MRALALSLIAALAAPLPDTPYEELVPSARPLASAWPATLPTGWVALPCARLPAAGARAPAMASSASPVGAVFVCTDASAAPVLFSATLGRAIDVDAGMPPDALATGVLVGHPALTTLMLLVPNASVVYTLTCAADACATTAAVLPVPAPPVIRAAVAYPSLVAGWTTVWATASGIGGDTVAWDVSPAGDRAALFAGPLGWGGDAIAHSATLHEVAVGNATKLTSLDADKPGVVRHWEWATDVPTGSGGPYDDAITALAFDESSGGVLYVGTPTCLDVRYVNGSVARIAGRAGLPWGNITAIAIDPITSAAGWPVPRVWLGTTRGVVLWDPTAPSRFGGAVGDATLRQRWRYMYGSRYLASTAADPFAGVVLAAGIAPGGPASVHVLTTVGLTTLSSEQWTLAAKAALYEAAVPRHMRLNQMCACSLSGFGVAEPCTTGPDDNNGLWTSLLVAAAAMQYAVTGADSARDLAWRGFEGMHLLMRATGIRGLISRSVLAPGSDTGSGTWHNSTVPGLEGYLWKGDASSDEVCGHLVAYPLAARIVARNVPGNASIANGALLDLTRYIVQNGYRLIDVTGQPTTWGHWEPALINGNRFWSDERGLNSLQMLGLLAAGLAAVPDPADPDHVLFAAAWEDLRAAGYLGNLLNLKIAAPSDDNYSDDELALWAYFGFMYANSSAPADAAAAAASLTRTWSFLRPERSALWNAMCVSLGLPATDPAVAADTAWNLRTWPLSLIDWPVRNTHRLDIHMESDPDRTGSSGNDAVEVLPANERSQDRWNGNPHDLDGGGGFTEDDPSAFLMSYWAARWAGLLDGPA